MATDQHPLHILHLTAGSDAGGVSRYIRDLSDAMVARGHRVTVAGELGAWHSLFGGAPYPWVEAPMKGGPVGLGRAWWKLRRIVKAERVDVIHAHYRKAAVVGRWLQRRPELTPFNDAGPFGLPLVPPVLFTLHLSPVPMGGAWGRGSWFGDHLHVASSAARAWVLGTGRVAEKGVTMIPHGVDAARFPVVDVAGKVEAKRQLGFGAFDRVAAFVGRFEAVKNPHWMLDVAAGTRERIPRLKVLMVGQGPEDAALRTAVARERLSDRVVFLPYQDPVRIYQAADAVLLPSAREGFSLVTAEAMACGVPVLRTRTSGTAETIVEGLTGKSVEIDRAKFLIAAAGFLADDEGLKRMGAGAAGFVREKLTFERQVGETIGLYRRVVAERE